MDTPSSLDYGKIILILFKDSMHNLPNQLYRTFKEAQKKSYTADEFFNGCFEFVEHLYSLQNDQQESRKYMLRKMIADFEAQRQRIIDSNDVPPNNPALMFLTGGIQNCENELSNLKPENFSATVPDPKNTGFIFNLSDTDISYIKKSIVSAQEMYRTEIMKQINPNLTYMRDTIESLGESFEDFEKNYGKIIQGYLSRYKHSKEIDYIEEELPKWESAYEYLKTCPNSDHVSIGQDHFDDFDPYHQQCDTHGTREITFATRKKIEFLKTRRKALLVSPHIPDKFESFSHNVALISQSAKDYIAEYDDNLQKFLSNYEANELDYINEQIVFWEEIRIDIENQEASVDGFGRSNLINEIMAAVRNKSYKKVFYACKNKLSFLEEKKDFLSVQNQTAYNETHASSNQVKQTKNISSPDNSVSQPVQTYHLENILEKEKWVSLKKFLMESYLHCNSEGKAKNKKTAIFFVPLVRSALKEKGYTDRKFSRNEIVLICKETFNLNVTETRVSQLCNSTRFNYGQLKDYTIPKINVS